MENKQSKETKLQEQLGYFSAYKKLPFIAAVILLALFSIWGIVDPCVFYYHGYYGSHHYGIMQLPNGFLCWLIWVVIGAVVAVCTYFVMKIAFSYKLLQIHYLQEIAKKGKAD